MKEVVVVIGSGQIGQAIARRVAVAKHLVLADVREETRLRRRTSSPGRLRGQRCNRRRL
jgi:predicted dinucleotide-binding enzyme